MASTTRKIAHSTLLQFIGKIVSTVLALVFIAIITRHLGVANYGKYQTIMVFVGIFSIVADLGLYIYIVNEISRGIDRIKASRIMSNVFTLRIFTAAILLGISPLVAMLFPYDGSIVLGIAIASMSMFFISANQVLIGIFQKEFKTGKVALGEIFGRIFQVLFVGMAVYFDLGLMAILWGVVLGSFVNFIYVFFSAKKYVDIKIAFEFSFYKQVLKTTWPIALSIVLNMIYFKVDTIFLSVIKGDYEVGLYGEAYKILEVLIAFPAIFAGLITPLFAKYAYVNPEKFKTVLQKGFDTMFMLALPIVIGGVMFSQDIVVFVGGPAFIKSAPILSILVIAVAAIFIGNMFSNAVVSLKKQKQMLWSYAFVAVVAVILYSILIPKYSYIGAAWGTAITEVLIACLGIFVVYRASKAIPSLANAWKVVLASGIMALAIYIMPSWHFSISMVLGSLVYLVSLYLVKGVSKELFVEVFGRSKNI